MKYRFVILDKWKFFGSVYILCMIFYIYHYISDKSGIEGFIIWIGLLSISFTFWSNIMKYSKIIKLGEITN